MEKANPRHDAAISFLLRAREGTRDMIPQENPTRPDSHELRYAEPDDGWLYVDSFLGHGAFGGTEVIWQNGVPLWTLHYCGHVTGPGFDADFLREALRQATPEDPFRGPIEYQQGSLMYVNSHAGDFAWFFGREEVYQHGNCLYECIYHGSTLG